MKTHPCPRCGKDTEGSYTEGGILIAICETCNETDNVVFVEARRKREEYLTKQNKLKS